MVKNDDQNVDFDWRQLEVQKKHFFFSFFFAFLITSPGAFMGSSVNIEKMCSTNFEFLTVFFFVWSK